MAECPKNECRYGRCAGSYEACGGCCGCVGGCLAESGSLPRPEFVPSRWSQVARYHCPRQCGWHHDEPIDPDADQSVRLTLEPGQSLADAITERANARHEAYLGRVEKALADHAATAHVRPDGPSLADMLNAPSSVDQSEPHDDAALWQALADALNALEDAGLDPVTRVGGSCITGCDGSMVQWSDELATWIPVRSPKDPS